MNIVNNSAEHSAMPQLVLADGSVFLVEKQVRFLPKRRLVLFGLWQGKACVAKLFFDKRCAKRHFEREIAGINILHKHRIPTPLCYAADVLDLQQSAYAPLAGAKTVFIIITEHLTETNNLHDLWQEQQCQPKAIQTVLASLMVELATQHVFGIYQHDLHLGNFLVDDEHICTLDAGTIHLSTTRLSKKRCLQHLGLLLSQLGFGATHLQQALFQAYAKARGWQIKPKDQHYLSQQIKQWNAKRARQFKKKIMRSSTQFSCFSSKRLRGVYDQSYAHEEFLYFLQHPETAFYQPSTTVLKAGRSATVIKTTLDGMNVVIKRYNVKNNWHGFCRLLKKTRAAKAWKSAQELFLFGIATAKPLAFIEQKYPSLQGPSYFVSAYIPGEHIGQYLSRYREQTEKMSAIVQQLKTLFQSLSALKMTHGDFKMTNILINAQEQACLIDLDGAKKHLTPIGLKIAAEKDKKRLLRNFQDQDFFDWIREMLGVE